MLNASNVNADPSFKIGLCYFDPIEEVIFEIGNDSTYILGADPDVPVVHKLLVVTSSTDRITKLRLSLNKTRIIEDKFDIKIQPGSVQPSIASFDDIPNFNSLSINGPIEANTIIPVYLYVKTYGNISSLSNLPIDIEYEYI